MFDREETVKKGFKVMFSLMDKTSCSDFSTVKVLDDDGNPLKFTRMFVDLLKMAGSYALKVPTSSQSGTNQFFLLSLHLAIFN